MLQNLSVKAPISLGCVELRCLGKIRKLIRQKQRIAKKKGKKVAIGRNASWNLLSDPPICCPPIKTFGTVLCFVQEAKAL